MGKPGLKPDISGIKFIDFSEGVDCAWIMDVCWPVAHEKCLFDPEIIVCLHYANMRYFFMFIYVYHVYKCIDNI